MGRLKLRAEEKVRELRKTQEADGIRQKEEEYLALRKALADEKEAFKRRTRQLENRLNELAADLKEAAMEQGVTELSLVAFRPRTKRKVLVRRFLEFLETFGRRERFFEIAEVPVGKATEVCGEEPLRQFGALTYETDPYATIVEK